MVRHYLCASPNYLKENNAPKTLDDLKGHRLLHFGTAKRGTWRFKHADQKKEEMLEFSPALNSNSGQFLFNATVQGQGIANLPDFILGNAFETGQLVALLPQYQIADYFICLLRSENRRINRRMRMFSQEIIAACNH